MFKALSIRLKLAIILSVASTMALSIFAIILFYYTYTTEQKSSLETLKRLSQVSSENLRAALAFVDHDSAEKILNPLLKNPHIISVLIHTKPEMTFFSYHSEHHPKELQMMAESCIAKQYKSELVALFHDKKSIQCLKKDFMVVIEPIVFENETIGILALVSDTKAVTQKLTDLLWMQIGVVLVLMVMIFFISMRLQKIFTQPIVHLIQAMEYIGKTNEYSHEIKTKSRDEFKTLYDYFNHMLQEIRKRDEELSLLASTDSLTGLYNRRYATDILQNLLKKAYRKKDTTGLIMVDIDYFKRINDTYGHPFGDSVLITLAKILKQCARDYDSVVRLGGEEFLVICESCTVLQCEQIAERIRETFASYTFEYSTHQELHYTLSAGYVAACIIPDQIEEALQVVDNALYSAKENGRNRIVRGELKC